MKKIITLFIVLVILISSLIISNIVQANEQELNNEIEVKTNVVGQKQEVSILVKLYNTKEINTYKAKIKYDKNIWEKLTESNFEVKGNWEQLKYNEENDNFILINKESIK